MAAIADSRAVLTTKVLPQPDKQEKATLNLLEQAESICADVVETNT